MGAAQVHDIETDETYVGGPSRALVLAPDSVVVRRNGRLLAAVAVVAGVVGVAYLSRATSTGAVVDWALTLLMGGIAVGYLVGLVDARTPLLVADPQGVRIRLGRTWRGLTWSSLERVEHAPAGRVRDGRLLLVSRNPQRTLDGLSGAALRQARWSERLYGEPLAVPLGLSTRTSHPDDELTAALQDLAAGSTLVVEPLPVLETDAAPETDEPETDEVPVRRRFWRDPRPVIAETIDRVAASGTPAPLREATPGRRAEVTVPLAAEAPVADDTQPIRLEAGELRRPGSVSLVEDTQAWGDRDWDDHVHPIARGGASVEPLVIDDFAAEPAPDPVVGPELAAARTRLGLTVDELAERTRIRPHVIEAIEVDDFEACGGDFYARGHLRTLARVLGVDVAPLLADFEERYSQAPIDPRKVFEAELASGGSIRGTRGGPNWSVLVAAVMALVLAWSVARLIMDAPVELPLGPGPQRLGRARQRRPAGRTHRARAAPGRRWRRPRGGPRRLGQGRLHRRHRLRADQGPRGLAAGARRVVGRVRRGGRGRQREGVDRRHRGRGERHLRRPLSRLGNCRIRSPRPETAYSTRS